MATDQTFFSNNIRYLGFVSVMTFGAVGDGVTDDRAAISDAMTAAVALGSDVFFPPGTYSVGKSPTGAWCLDCPGDNLTLRGVRGASFIRAAAGLPASSTALFRINQRKNITIRDLGWDGNWGNVATVCAASMTGLALPQATINVASTNPDGISFPSSGTCVVQTSAGLQTITYTGITATSFTGCTGGTGTCVQGYPVGLVDSQTGINQGTQGDPKNYGIFLRGTDGVTIDNCIIRNTYGDAIWLGQGATDFSTFAQNTIITRTRINMTARDGIACGQKCASIRMSDCQLSNCYTQAWDTEAVGPGNGVHDVVITGNYFGNWWAQANPARDGNLCMTITGGNSAASTQADGGRNFRVTDNTILGAISIFNATFDVVIQNNRIVCDWDGKSYSPVSIGGYCEDVRIVDNYIYDRTVNGAAVSVAYYAAATANYQPTGVVVRGNRIHARAGNFGVNIVGTGGHDFGGNLVPGVTGTATGVAGLVVTTSSSFTLNQWIGYQVRIGSATGTIVSNTAGANSTFTVTLWTTPLGEPVPTPSPGAFTILSGGGYVDIADNFIDCSDDGYGQGGDGVVFVADRAGMRVKIRRNEILNPALSGVRINSANRAVQYLEVSDNLCWNNQITPTTLQAVNFLNGITNLTTKLILRGNSAGAQVATNVTGLTSGVWLIEDGVTQRWAGWDSPNGVIAARVGSTFQRLDDGTAAAMWVKQSNDGLNSGWVRLTDPPVLSWDVDPGSGIGVPSNATQWAAVIEAAGLTGVVPVPDALWLCNETSGNLADSIGSFTLTANGVGLLYNQNVSAWQRNGVATSANASGRWFSTDAGLPDVSVNPITVCCYGITGAEAGANPARMIMGVGTGPQAYVGGSTSTRVVSNASAATATGTQWTVMRPYWLRHNPGGSQTKGGENINALTPVFSAAVTGKQFTFGGLAGNTNPSSTVRVYAWAWFAAITDAQLRQIFTTLGWEISW